MFVFRKIWCTLFSYYLRLEILSFAFLPTNLCGYGYFTASFEQVLYSVRMWENTDTFYAVNAVNIFQLFCTVLVSQKRI